MSGYEPVSVWGNWFVAIDGEGTVGDEYALLDCSLDEVDRLYTGKRLTSIECLDWLWELAKYAGMCEFVLYGARYDYDNWLRDLTFDETVIYNAGGMVRVGPYAIIHQAGYKFELRRIKLETDNGLVYERIRTRTGVLNVQTDIIGMVLWDVLPYWQCKFVDAVTQTLGEKARHTELLEAGKKARGTFTHGNIDWVSRYNKAECHNLAWMMVELDAWFHSVGIRPTAYNGPGSAAKAMIRQYEPYLHAGRRL